MAEERDKGDSSPCLVGGLLFAVACPGALAGGRRRRRPPTREKEGESGGDATNLEKETTHKNDGHQRENGDTHTERERDGRRK